MDYLNSQQAYAANFNGKHLLVLAGPGTGKTRTIIARAKYLLQHGVSSDEIVILSFTRKSAREIVARISNELSQEHCKGLIGQTFHSWCMSIIKHYPKIFPQSGYTLIDREDQQSCFNLICGKHWDLMDSNDKRITPQQIIEVYSYAVNARVSLSDAIRVVIYENAPKKKDVEAECKELSKIVEAYIRYKEAHKYYDFDDILLVVSTYLKKNNTIRHFIAKRYKHILVDEMQDTNPLQYYLLSSFYEDCHLFCVGDDAQSIYGFRGADFQTIHNFEKVVTNVVSMKLTINYRSTPEILAMSNWLLKESPLKYDKILQSVKDHASKPIRVYFDSEYDMAEHVIYKIISHYSRDGMKWHDNLILARTVFALRPVERQLVKHKIPYMLYAGSKLMESKHIKDLVAAMRIVCNYQDELAWSRYLQIWGGIGPVKAAKIVGKVTKTCSLEDCLLGLIDMDLQPEISETLVEINDSRSNPRQAIERALKVMEQNFKERFDVSWTWREKDISILAELAEDSSTINDFIQEYIFDPKLEITKKMAGTNGDCVILSTIHSAKGLEATSVYIVDASPANYPSTRIISRGEHEIEEERRCLYVAMTRAKENLYIYCSTLSATANSHKLYFLQNMPSDLYDIERISGSFVDEMSEYINATIQTCGLNISKLNIYDFLNPI